MTDELETIQYLTFTMADELVVVDGARVLEILELADLANETQLPDFMRGVISLRGCLAPVVDLRLKFAVQEPVQMVSTFNVVVELAKDGEDVVLQAPTDDTRKAIEMNYSQVKAAPHWLRCRFSKNDLNALSQIFIHAAASTERQSEKGHPQPL
ncbi:chemotaxis protein CheW [Desulfobulbus sp.]|uniref:chemotaxis protein CheW n=1 Tax=Desulfobulbus sp. TaxID=895 RepID=UPI0027BAF732|nr:chemotaxis protein CheW [Desulfobulbus sp.]